MRRQYHRCPHLRLVRVDVSELSAARKGASLILEELCDAKQLTPCVGLEDCDILSAGAKRELLSTPAGHLRRTAGPSELSGVTGERRRELDDLRAAFEREHRRLVKGGWRALGQVRLQPESARRAAEWRTQAIGRALDAMDEGPFGFCMVCGGLIEIERLRVVPDTHVCVPCARKAEPPAGA